MVHVYTDSGLVDATKECRLRIIQTRLELEAAQVVLGKLERQRISKIEYEKGLTSGCPVTIRSGPTKQGWSAFYDKTEWMDDHERSLIWYRLPLKRGNPSVVERCEYIDIKDVYLREIIQLTKAKGREKPKP